MDIKQMQKYGQLIKDYTLKKQKESLREPSGNLKYKFIVPGSSYPDALWDWDSWLTDLVLGRLPELGDITQYEKGCIFNFLEYVKEDGAMPIWIEPDTFGEDEYTDGNTNSHKPCLAQHALFICEKTGNDAEWLREKFHLIEVYLGFYENKCKHETGLYYWVDDFAIGVDNDPCTFYRPKGSTASIYLNCLMYKELLATSELAGMLGLADKEEKYKDRAEALKAAIQEHCWDERDGFFYSVDINLVPIDLTQKLHSGCPRHWSCLIMRIGVWTGFMAMWAGIATPEQAERMVNEHYLNEKTFCSPYGVRSLSKMEKMYKIAVSGNPSCWLGPIWGIANYMVFEGLYKYGFIEEARSLAEKTITLFGSDIEKNGEMHEYYDPESGVGVHNLGFQSWNLLSLNMLDWIKNDNSSDE